MFAVTSVLETAQDLVRGARSSAYGPPLLNHARIARLWNARLHEKLTVPLTEEDVTSLMRLVKEARLMESPGHEDSLVDIAGYADVEYEIHLAREAPRRGVVVNRAGVAYLTCECAGMPGSHVWDARVCPATVCPATD